jgi:hypothetical protein
MQLLALASPCECWPCCAKSSKQEAIVDATPYSELPPAPTGRLMARTEQRHAEIFALLAQAMVGVSASMRSGLDRLALRFAPEFGGGNDEIGASSTCFLT